MGRIPTAWQSFWLWLLQQQSPSTSHPKRAPEDQRNIDSSAGSYLRKEEKMEILLSPWLMQGDLCMNCSNQTHSKLCSLRVYNGKQTEKLNRLSKGRGKCPRGGKKHEWCWNSRDIYIGLPPPPPHSEQNNYERRAAQMGRKSFIFHIGSW